MAQVKKPLKKHKIIGLDSLCFIYHFEQNANYLPATTQLFEAAEKGKTSLVTSVVSYLEVLVGPKRNDLAELVSQYKYIFHSFPNLIVVGMDLYIADLASDLRAKYNLRSPDAINLACAISMEASAFATNDKKLKKVKEIDIILLKDLL